MDKQWNVSTETMRRFTALFHTADAVNPIEANQLSFKLSEMLSESRLNLWKIGDPIVHAGRRTLIGVAPYSAYDLRLLGVLNELPFDSESDRIDVFDVLLCRTQEDLQNYVPGIGKVYQTPVLGIWQDGKLIQRDSGHNARQLLMQLYGIDEEQLRYMLKGR